MKNNSLITFLFSRSTNKKPKLTLSLSSRKLHELLGEGGVQSISQASSDAECFVDVESVDVDHHRLNTSTLEISANQSGLNPIFIENDQDVLDQSFNQDTSIVNIDVDDEQIHQYDDVFGNMDS